MEGTHSASRRDCDDPVTMIYSDERKSLPQDKVSELEADLAALCAPSQISAQEKQVTRITLNIHPVSTNAMYRALGSRIVISAEGRKFKDEMVKLLEETKPTRIPGAVRVKLDFEFKTRRLRDVDNYAKPMLDSLKGIMFNDDSDIYDLHLTKKVNCASECVHIECASI